MITLTRHAIERMQQRGIQFDLVELIIEFGTPRPKPGKATEYAVDSSVRHRTIQYLKSAMKQIERLEGKCVLVSDDGKCITVYHDA